MRAAEAILLLVILGAFLIMASVVVGRRLYLWWQHRKIKKSPWQVYVDYSQQGEINYWAAQGLAEHGLMFDRMQLIGTAAEGDEEQNLLFESQTEERVAFLNSQQRRLLRRSK